MSKSLRPWTRNFSSPFGRDFNEIFDKFFEGFGPQLPAQKTDADFSFNPSCEVSETDSHYEMKLDLPGVDKEHISIDLENNIMTISAERKSEKKEEDKKHYFSEINYGSYVRSFTLPQTVEESKIEAKYDKGVLLVKVPKTEAPKSTKINVQ